MAKGTASARTKATAVAVVRRVEKPAETPAKVYRHAGKTMTGRAKLKKLKLLPGIADPAAALAPAEGVAARRLGRGDAGPAPASPSAPWRCDDLMIYRQTTCCMSGWS
jgi:hypothetical protein